MRAGSERLRRSAAVVLAVAACLTGGFFAAGAFGNRSADPPLIVLDRSIGAVSLGSTRAQVEAAYGKPFKQLVVVGAGGAPAVLAYYRVHGATLYVTYQSGRVVSIETSSNYYRTRGGLGPGSSIEDVPRGFFQDPCGLGVWTGAGPAFTVFTRDGNEVSSVLITLSSYFSACEGEGSAPPAPPEPPASPGGGTTGTFELTVNVEPSGYGYVTGSAGGISCPVNCNAPYGAEASIALTAHPSTGAQFDHWSGACSGSGGCVVLMDGPKHVTAHFTGAPFIPPTTPTTTTRPTTTGGGGGGGGGQSP
jgi:hypothetical protein